MAKDFYVTNVIRNAYATDIAGRIDNGPGAGRVRIYSGAIPPTADDTESVNLLVEIPLAEPAYGAVLDGVIQLNTPPGPGTAGPTPAGGPQATHFRIYDGQASPAVVAQGTAGLAASDPDLVLSNDQIAENDEITLQTLDITVPNSLTNA